MELTFWEQIGVAILFSPLYAIVGGIIALVLILIFRFIGYIITGEEII